MFDLKNLLKQETLILLTTSRNKVVNEESWCVAVLGSQEFAVGRGVGEGNLVFGQVTAENKRAPENPKKNVGTVCISDACRKTSCDQMTLSGLFE